MTRIDPIIAVKNVEQSAEWYTKIFGFRKAHGGPDFAVLRSDDNHIVLCLHKWGEHDHPTMRESRMIIGNGLILYIRTDKIKTIQENVSKYGGHIEEELHLNPNSTKVEFSIRDPDGYYLTVTEFHTYNG